jgi:DNA-binding beta-propeller fold protein YncE
MQARSKRRIGGALVATLALGAMAGSPVAHAASGLAPFSASRGCVSAQPIAPCKKSNGAAGGPIVLSPDGHFAYVASYTSDAIAVFALHGGTVSQVPGPGGCIAGGDGRPGCMHDVDLDEPTDIVLSPDGRQAYVANEDGNEVEVFDRDATTGRLRPAPGIPGVRVEGPNVLASSPDGRELYVADGFGGIAVLARDPETGAIHLLEEVKDCLPGPHGCLAFFGFQIVVSPDGGNVYLSSFPRGRRNSGVHVIQGFNRNPLTGSLTPIAGPAGCATDVKAGSCQIVPQLEGFSMAISPDGKSLYVGAFTPGAIFAFDREPSGALEAKRGGTVCLGHRDHGSCSSLSLANAQGLVVSADGRKVYATGDRSLVALDRSSSGMLRVAGRLKHPSFNLGMDLALSPNGRVLYDSVAHPGGLRSFSLARQHGG